MKRIIFEIKLWFHLMRNLFKGHCRHTITYFYSYPDGTKDPYYQEIGCDECPQIKYTWRKPTPKPADPGESLKGRG